MSAFLEGWRRILRAPAITSGLLAGAILLALAFPSAVSPESAAALHAMGLSWLGWILSHELLGFGGVITLDPRAWTRLESFWSVNLVIWMFVTGGVLDRLARNRPTRTAAFFAASGVHFFRFLRLGALLALPFVALTRLLLFALDRTSTVMEIAVIVAMAIWSAIGDYAKVRIVVEDRRSALGALMGSVRFISRHPVQMLTLYLLDLLVMIAAFAIGREGGTFSWLVFVLLVLLYLLARLSFMASSIVLFQSKLAHAGYVAAPLPTWPDSPSAEAIDNLIKRRT